MDIAQLQQQAAEYLERDQYSDAIALYQQCIETNPSLMSSYWYLGLALLLKGEELEAQAVWLSALIQETPQEIAVDSAELLKVLEAAASRYVQFGNMHLVEIIYWQILELDSNQAEAHYHLGTAISHRGDLDAAVACWQRAIELKPDFADAYQNQGYTLQKQGRFEEAIPCYLKALEIQSDWTETHYNLGICFFQQGKLDEAITCFQKAIQLKPDYIKAYSDWGNALLEQGKLDEAITCFQKAIQLKPDYIKAYCNWRDSLLEQGKSDEAITSNACLIEALQIQSKSAEVYLYLGKALAREKKIEQAIISYRKAIQIQPNLDKIYFALGKALAQQGNLSEAVVCYQKTIQIQGMPLAEVYLCLGKALVQQGNLTEAIICYQKVIEINPISAEVYFDLGNALGTSGQLDEAISFYQKALEINPDWAEVYCSLGIALAQADNSDAAIACFQKVMEINPNLAKSIYNIMINLCQQDKLDEGAIGFQKILPVASPNEFYESTWDWAVTHKLDRSNYISIYPKNQVDLKPPITTDKAVDFAFRFGTKIELPATFVAVVPDGHYWLNQYQDQTAIIASGNKLLADVSPDFPVLSPGHPDKHPSRHLIFSSEKLPPAQSIDGTVAVLSGLLNDVYFHWMFDILPRIELLRRSGIKIGCIDLFLINSRKFFPFHRETLDALGIPETKRLENYKYPHIKATRLVVPSFPGSIAWMPKWACNFLRIEFLNKRAITKSEKIERLYISRQQATNRRIINENEVISFLNEFGFKSVTLESMSVAEQVSLMADAKVVLAPHGSGLSNIVFCNPATKVIEIFSPNYVYPCYWLISNIVGLKYYYLIGENFAGFYLNKLLYPSPGSEDIFVSLDSLLKVLKLAKVA